MWSEGRVEFGSYAATVLLVLHSMSGSQAVTKQQGSRNWETMETCRRFR